MHDSDILLLKIGIPDKNNLFATLFIVLQNSGLASYLRFWSFNRSKTSILSHISLCLCNNFLQNQSFSIWVSLMIYFQWTSKKALPMANNYRATLATIGENGDIAGDLLICRRNMKVVNNIHLK